MKQLMWAVVALAACDVSLDAGTARITCASTAECPEPMVCKENLGLCMLVDGDDVAPPSVSTALVDPALATAGTTVTLTLTTDEPLALDPIVTFGAGSVFAVVEADATRRSFVLRYVVRGTESAGSQALQARLIDASGNESSTVVSSFALDFIAPRLGAASWSLAGGKRRVKLGDEVTFSGRTDNDAAIVRAVLFADELEVEDVTEAFGLSDPGDGLGLVMRGSFVLDAPALVDGAVLSIGLALSDAAGNVTDPGATRGPGIDFDVTPPSGILTLPNSSVTTTVTALLNTTDAAAVRLSGDLTFPVDWQTPVLPSVTVLLTAGNGSKSVIATFRDEAGNEASTAPSTVALALPPGPGAAGQPCIAHDDCDSLQCRCADGACGNRRCAADASCGPCRTVDGSGACIGSVTTELTDPLDCNGTKVCGAGGACLSKRGAACESPSECVTTFCECANGGCTAKLCADADCAVCKVGQSCSANRNNDVTCASGQVCRVGACVTRNPGTCTASCSGGFNQICPGGEVDTDNCTTSQGFSPSIVGSCPSSGYCGGSIGCQCF